MKGESRGFTLVELLIALSLGSMLSLAIVSFFQSQTTSVSLAHATNRTISTVQFTHKVLRDAIRMSGFLGGVSDDQVEHRYFPLAAFPGDCDTAWVFDLNTVIGGFEGESSPSSIQDLPNACLPKDYVPYSDALWVKYANPQRLINEKEIDNKAYQKRYMLRSKAAEMGVLFDGYHASEARAILPNDELVHNREFVVSLYYLSACREDCEHSGNTLSHYTLMGNRFIRRDLATGIEQMQLEYGVDLNGNGIVDRYQLANDMLGEVGYVLSVKVYLLIRHQFPERDYFDGDHTVGSLAQGAFKFESTGQEQNYRRRVYEFEVARRNVTL